MPKMNSLIKMISAFLALTALVACSGGNSAAPPMVSANGKHADNWVQQHWVAYKQANGGSREVSSTTGCSECHGSDLSGGLSKVSCFSATFNGMFCHANDDHTLGHPRSWGDPASSGFHGAAGVSFNGVPVKGSDILASNFSCGLCHATDSNVTLAGSAPSCLSTDPKWGISCHSTSPAVSSSGCVSCHGTPPSASQAPNRAGAHATHLALSGVSCGTCHAGAGTGTRKHATGAFVNHSAAFITLVTTYKAQTGGFSYTGGKCAAVSCHGGRQSPSWNGGTVADCLSCHQPLDAQAPQYNGFFSGNFAGENLHQFHLAARNRFTGNLVFCTDCHNASTLSDAQHFGGLATPEFELAAGDTIGGGSTRISSYNKSTGSCSNSCHTEAPNPAHWN